MFKAYQRILGVPGTAQFMLASALARFPMSMQAFSIILMISLIYDQYALAGQVNAAAVVSSALGTPILGRLVDRYGQRRVARPAVFIYALAFIALVALVITKQHPILLYPMAMVLGLLTCPFGAYSRARWSYVLKDDKQVNTAFALEAAVDEVVYLFAPIIATVLVQSVHPSAGGLVCVVIALIGGLWFLSQRASEPPASSHSETLQHRGFVLKNIALASLCFVCLTSGITYGGLDIAVVAYARDIGHPNLAGLIIGFIAVGSFTSAMIYGSRNWPVSPLWLFTVGMALMGLFTSLLVFATRLVPMCVVMTLCGVFYAPTMTNANNIIREVVPESRFTEGMAWFATSWTVGLSIGASLGGNIIDLYGWYGGMVLMALCSLGMVVTTLVAAYPIRRSIARLRDCR